MTTNTYLAVRRLSILAILFMLSTSVLAAQVRIKERVEITPKIKISKRSNSNSTTSNTIPLMFSDGYSGIFTTRPCHLNAYGSINSEWGEYPYGSSWLWMEKDYYTTYNLYTIWGSTIANTSASFDVGGCFQVNPSAYRSGAMDNVILPGEVSGDQAAFGRADYATATVTASPIPGNELSTISMTASPAYLDANDDGSHESTIESKFYNGYGNIFEPCWDYNQPWMEIKIEDPLSVGGMTIKAAAPSPAKDGSIVVIEDTSKIEVGSVALGICYFTWDGRDLPEETYVVSICLTANGLTEVQPIELKKDIHPKVQITSPAQDTTIFVTERRQPVINFLEKHKPKDGMREPAIRWNPGNVIDIKDFYNRFEDTMSLFVKVTATNSAGEASDVRTVLLKKVEDVDHFNVTISPDTIFSKEYAQLSAVAMDKYGNETEIEDNTIINVSASPDEYINYPNEVQYGDLKAGYIYLYAREIPVPVKDYIFTVSWNNASGTAKLVVKRPPCIYLSASPAKIGTGEKAAIIIQQLDFLGNLTSFPPEQYFTLLLNTDEQYGRLHCISSGGEGSYVFGQAPFEFISAESIDVDSTIAEIEASLGGGANSIGIITKDTLRAQKPVIMSKQSNAGSVIARPEEMNRKKLGLTINSLQNQLKKESKKKGREKQQELLAMTIQQFKARLAYDTAKTAYEKQNALASIKQLAKLATETAECKSIDTITIVKEEDCIKVKHASLSVGDTVTLSFEYIPSGRPVPAYKMLDVWISGGDGSLLVNGVTGARFSGAAQPIKFIAPKSISGDSLLVYIEASKSESGGGGPAASFNQKDSLKTPSNKKSTINASILKTTTCGAGDVTVKQFPPCLDFTFYDIMPLARNDCGAGGYVDEVQPDIQSSFIDPLICSNKSGHCYGLMLPTVHAGLKICVGGPDAGVKEVNSKDDVKDAPEAIKVTKDLTDLVNRIREVYANYDQLLPGGQLSYDQKWIDMSKVHSTVSNRIHENNHVEWFHSLFENALNFVKTKLPECTDLSGMNNEQIENYFKPKIDQLKETYNREFYRSKKYELKFSEMKSHDIQRQFIEKLIGDIEIKFKLNPVKK